MTKIVLVGEAWGEQEEIKGLPFVGPAGGMLNAFLSAAHIHRGECYLTNVLNLRPPGNKFEALCGPKTTGIPDMPSVGKGKYLHAQYGQELTRLYREIRDVNPNVVVALGAKASWALLKDPRIKRLRGSAYMGITGHKVFPTYHPSAVLRDYQLRPIVLSDFKKIRGECEDSRIYRPAREFWVEPTIEDIRSFEQYILPAQKLSVDIETWNRQVTMVGFAPSVDRAIVIPFCWRGTPDGNYWRTEEEEIIARQYVRKWLQLGIPLVGQNFNYDMYYFWKYMGMKPLQRPAHAYNLPGINDTMLTHHAQEPEMEKSLALLSSLHTREPQHKFMRDKSKGTLKKED